jgi:O-antigen ligase
MPDMKWGGLDEPAPLIWRWPALRLALVAVPLALTFTILTFSVGPFIRTVGAVTLGVSLVSPAGGLLLVTAVTPFGQMIATAMGADDFRIGEVIVLAFLTGWLLRALPDRHGPRAAAPWAGWLFAVTIVASVAGLTWQLGRYAGEVPLTIDQTVHGYFYTVDRIGLVEGARLLEGLALAAATVTLFRRHPRLAESLPLTLASSAAPAAAASLLLWRGIGTAAALQRSRLIGYRISAHVGDVNAAGSYFAMTACLALGMAMRASGRRRIGWLCLAAASGAGLWLSRSRSALGAAGAVIIVAMVWAATARFRTRGRALTLGVVVVALLAAAGIRARVLETDPEYRGVGYRSQFVQASLRMVRARPLFGVGEGQYYPTSRLFLSPQLAWTYGAENAHNFFLQVGGELGVVGLGLFVAWLAAALGRAARALWRAPDDTRLLGVTGGVVAFLITCLTGHPFLVNEVAWVFWIQFGLMTALAGSTLMDGAAVGGSRASGPPPRPSWAVAAAAAVAILFASPLATARAELRAPESQDVDGFYQWETLEDGTRFRWTGHYASLFVPADVTRVEIPVRVPTDGRSIRPMGVEVMTAAVDRGRTMVDGAWAILSISLPPAGPPTRFKRIDLRVDRVWQPALFIAGSADMRVVGLQVGEPRLVRD